MVILHMHKGGIRICLAIIIPALKTCRMPVIVPLAFKKPAEHFQIPLVPVLPFTSSINKDGFVCPAFSFQKPGYLLQILRPCLGTNRKVLYVFMIQQMYCFLYLPEHRFFPFPNRPFPHKSIQYENHRQIHHQFLQNVDLLYK